MNVIGARIALVIIAGLFAIVGPAAPAQQFEAPTPTRREARPQRYLADTAMNFGTILAAPPAAGSAGDEADRQLVEALQNVDSARYESAELDSAYLYPRFDDAFGQPIRRETAPTLVSLLNRAMRDVSALTFLAKGHFRRPRPYQRFQLRRVCGEERPPAPDHDPMTGSSYPSGHASYGWATAMILARVRPERGAALMARAAEYAESRVVCGVHFPSDISAGHVIAAALIGRLDAEPQFQADLARAREELASAPVP